LTEPPTHTPTPTTPVVLLPSTGQGDAGISDDLPRIILLAVAGMLLLAAAGFTARRVTPSSTDLHQ
jgi:hypothetical protein